ncbi:MAG: hypothetical protein GF390_03755 [Candidatus Pacebacteria bacterium]|nr:hypothetical protein [Candidatus Paceibacterota bacterium]
MKYLIILVILLALVGGGVFWLKKTAGRGVDTISPTGKTRNIEDKQGNTVKTGLITAAGNQYFITEAGGSPEEIKSYNLELDHYVGQQVTVTGQYSGDTLFVSQLE